MKRNISAILINALLIQFVGCYSQKVITYDEFYTLQNLKEATVVTSDKKTINLTSDSLKNNYMHWRADTDTLTIYSTHLEKAWSNILKEVSDTVWLPKDEITNVYVDEFDETKTIFAIAIPITLIILSIIAVNNMSGVGIGGGNY